MDDIGDWAFPDSVQPQPEDVRVEVPEDAFTASILGTERTGNGVVIRDDGLVLTIGYLITEAETVWLATNRGAVVAGHPLAYDQATGFGLIQPLGRLDIPALPRGSAAHCTFGDDVIIVGHGGRAHALRAKVIAVREFAGYWEYVLDEAVFTAPAHPQWGGAALVGAAGELLGIGSLLVEETVAGQSIQGNMIVPIDLLGPILDDMLNLGRPARPPRPWLGMYTTELRGQLVVGGLAEGGPAHRAGVKMKDMVLEVAGERVAGLADLFRRVWRLGDAGVEVPLTLARGGELVRVRLRSADRNDFLKKPRLH